MFVGRTTELELIDSLLSKESSSILIYGKRKVGKTTLINKALEGRENTVYYECIKDTVKANIDGLVDVLYRQRILPGKIEFSTFQDLFRYINSLPGKYDIVIDEYPYLKVMNKAETVDSVFQSIIDNNLSNIHLFISGSYISVMKDLLKEKNALYGRFDAVLHLNELDYVDAAEFYPDKSDYDKVAFYSVFGGSPFINEFIDNHKSIRENIENTILNPLSPVYSYAENLLLSDFSNSSGAERIFSAISNGRKKYGEIESQLHMGSNGLLSKQLAPLLDSEILSKTFPINRPDDSKKVFYEINDNYLRFYYAFVYKNKSALTAIGAHAFYDEYISKSITDFISRRFERICRDFFSLAVKSGRIKGVRNIGTYYYDNPSTKTNGEFDLVLQRKDSYDVYEVKYLKKPLSLNDMKKEEGQIIVIPDFSVADIGFISVSGYEEYPNEYKCLTAADIYSVKE
ncbi:MAG: AAA family ATPase [Clostridiales bacterium]|nr:AAA family ATPase [Clostridiales bacterium]